MKNDALVTAYPAGEVVGPCVCGSWPGGQCFKCSRLPSMPICIPQMSVATVNKVRELEKFNAQREQTPITTYHLIHAGMYARTITIPAGVLLTGALIKRATILIVNGDVSIATGEMHSTHLKGYHVIPASAHRKQAILAHADTQLTMLFPTDTKNICVAEDELTDEADLLFSRHGENVINVTGE